MLPIHSVLVCILGQSNVLTVMSRLTLAEAGTAHDDLPVEFQTLKVE